MSKLIIKFRFATTPVSLLNNKSISLKAKGLYAYIQSKPDDWDFTIDKIASQCQEGYTAVKSALDELKINGYLRVDTLMNAKGHWDSEYTLYPESYLDVEVSTDPMSPGVGLPDAGSTDAGQLHAYSNIEKVKKISKIDECVPVQKFAETEDQAQHTHTSQFEEITLPSFNPNNPISIQPLPTKHNTTNLDKLKQATEVAGLEYDTLFSNFSEEELRLQILENIEYNGSFKPIKLIQFVRNNYNQRRPNKYQQPTTQTRIINEL
jgi:hypothetical protein